MKALSMANTMLVTKTRRQSLHNPCFPSVQFSDVEKKSLCNLIDVKVNSFLVHVLLLQSLRRFGIRAVLNKTGNYQPILLIFNTKHGMALGYFVSKFEENRTKITAVRVPHTKNAKWPP